MRKAKNTLSTICSLAVFLTFNGCKDDNPLSPEKPIIKNPVHRCQVINTNDSNVVSVWAFSLDTINHINDTIMRDTLLPGEASVFFEMKSNGFYRVGAFWLITYGNAWVEQPIWPAETDPLNYKIYIKESTFTVTQSD